MSRNILISDDDEDILVALGQLLQGYGFQVETAKTVKELKDKLNQKPQVLILDYYQPKFYPQKFIRNIKNNNGGNKIKLIVISANEEVKKEVISSGADHFLPKPLDIGILLKQIN